MSSMSPVTVPLNSNVPHLASLKCEALIISPQNTVPARLMRTQILPNLWQAMMTS